jgi:hypothetical protein
LTDQAVQKAEERELTNTEQRAGEQFPIGSLFKARFPAPPQNEHRMAKSIEDSIDFAIRKLL